MSANCCNFVEFLVQDLGLSAVLMGGKKCFYFKLTLISLKSRVHSARSEIKVN